MCPDSVSITKNRKMPNAHLALCPSCTNQTKKCRHHVIWVDPGDRGIPHSRSETGPRSSVNLGSSFYRKYKKIGSNRSSHSEFLTCIERLKKIMAQELTDAEMNQQMDQHEAVSITCTLCEKVILRTETCARTKCCRHYVHFDCFTRALDE